MPSLIKKRGKKRYRASVTFQGTTRQTTFPDATKKSFREAVIWEEETRKELEALSSKTGSEYLERIGDWANEYLEDVHNRFTAKTFQEKKSAFERFFKHAGMAPEMLVKDIPKSAVRKFLSKQFKDRSGYAANKERKNLGTAWNWGRDILEGWPRAENPFLAIKKFPEIRSPRYVPPEYDFWSVFEVAEGQDQLMLLALLHLAARRGEIFKLKWSDVDFSTSRIRLWTKKREGGHQECDWLPLTPDLKKALLAWREKLLAIAGIDKEHVFICLDENPVCEPFYGKPFAYRQFFMRRLCKKAGVKPFGFHAIRHLTASILYQKGYPLSVVQAILRHKNPNTTVRYLQTLGLEQTREALEEGLRGPAHALSFETSSEAKVIPLKQKAS
jgi:integrase